MPGSSLRLARLHDGTTTLVLPGEDQSHVDLVMVSATLDRSSARSSEENALAEALPDRGRGSWRTLIDSWEVVEPALRSMEEPADAQTDEIVRLHVDLTDLAPPLPSHDISIFALGANFAAHAARSEQGIDMDTDVAERERQLVEQKAAGLPPWGFSLFPRTVVGPRAEIRPPGGVRMLDYEGEVAVVLRSDGTIWGYTAWNDLSIRDPHFGIGPAIDRGPMTWTLQKNFLSANVCGPYMVVGDSALRKPVPITTRVNGETRQDGSTADMVYGFSETVEHVGAYTPLATGDMIASGTPAGTALEDGLNGRYLHDGDVVEVEVGDAGVQRNVVVQIDTAEGER